MYEQQKYLRRRRATRKLGLRPEDAVKLTMLPGFSGRTRPVAKRRIAALRAHLEACLAEMPGTPSAEGADPGPATALESAICGMCRGACCVNGADHAYLKPGTLAAQLEDGADPQPLIAAYLSHVPKRGYVGSCIYHGAEGCGLPREMRSTTCRRHFCTGLHGLRATPAAPASTEEA